MKNTKQKLSWLLVLVMIIGLLSGCGNSTSKNDSSSKETSSQVEVSSQQEVSAVEESSEEVSQEESSSDETSEEDSQVSQTESCEAAGEYMLDGTPLGMPMTWYLKISEEGSFQISTKRDYAADKGNGQVAANNGTFVLVYSDSTNDAPKNATFHLEKGNAYFTTSLPIGTANMPGSEEEPFIGYCFANEDLLGDYVSSYDSEGAMGSVHYDQELTLSTGRRYTYTSVFTMKSNTYKYVEMGSFEIKDTDIILSAEQKVTAATLESGELTPCDPDETAGTIEDGKITIALATSPMKADKVENVFTAATTAEAAGQYLALKQTEMFTLNAVLTLGKDGTYSYEASFVSEKMGDTTYAEQGGFVITDTGVTLSPEKTLNDQGEMTALENAASIELTRDGMQFTGKLPTGAASTEMTLFQKQIVGHFEAADLESGVVDEKQYVPSMVMLADGTFVLTVTTDGEDSYVCEGTFAAEEGMITFTYEGGAYRFIAMMSDNSFNAKNIPLDESGTEASFEFVPKAVEENPVEESQVEESQAEESKVEESKAEESQAEESKSEESQTEAGQAESEASVIRSFSGGYVSESAMGTTQYSLSLNLKDNDTYRLESVFVMGGKAYVSAEEGAYVLDGEALSLTPEKTTTMATIESGELTDIPEAERVVIPAVIKEGKLTMNHKASCMAKAPVDLEMDEKDVVVKVVEETEYNGIYVSESAMGTTVYDQTLKLKSDNTYRFESCFSMKSAIYVSAEEGIYTLEGEKLTLNPEKSTTMATIESGELVDLAEEDRVAIEGSLKDGVVTMTHKASCMAKKDAELTLSAPAVYKGAYTSESAMGTTQYALSMILKGNNTYRYEASFTMKETTYVSAEEGTFTLEDTVLTLTPVKSTTMATIESGELEEIAEEAREAIIAFMTDGKITMNRKVSCMAKSAVDLEVSAPVVFKGNYTSETGIGNIEYTMAMTLGSDGTYRFESAFEMLGAPYVSIEEGIYELDGEVLTLTPKKTTTMNTIEAGELVDIAEEDQAQTGGTVKEGILTMTHKPSCMAKAEGEIVLNQ